MSNQKSVKISSSEPIFKTLPKLPANWKKLQMQANMQKIEQYNMRKWMKLRGKKSLQQETVHRKDLRKVFEQLDTDKSGTLCIEELYKPLLSLGLVEKVQEVEQLIEYIGSKSSGIVEFHEFLRAFDSTRAKKHNRVDVLLRNIEKNIISTQKSELPFNLYILNQRRNLLLSAYLGETPQDKDKGMRVLKAYTSNLECTVDPTSKLQRIIWRRASDYAKINNRISKYKSKFDLSNSSKKSSRTSLLLSLKSVSPLQSSRFFRSNRF